MGLKGLHRRFKALRVKGFLTGNADSSKKEGSKKPSWMTPISHGFHVVEHQLSRSGFDAMDSNSDSVIVQREQIQSLEVWLFGVSDAQTGDGVTKYLQSHLFDKNLNESQLKRKSKETMKKAYVSIRAKVGEGEKENETRKMGCASAIVINGVKLVVANMGYYRAIVCKNGVATEVGQNYQRRSKRRWSLNLITGVLRFPRVRLLACESGNSVNKHCKISGPGVGVVKIDSDLEFIILTSNGVLEVMKNQEAVNLIRHIDDPQEAAECLAKEALTRMSKSNISCLIIRLD